ncbi:hypothetical protein [Burkholderia sp. MBR-1]|uniref:hypothetical protein n=1 Tax=Burkholderia sp. MBR-1 TaxID=2732364 RepID=UPI0015EE71B2|nr:hypothetical protein [Burkholderia sp. MBR-1]QMI49714.1 hypothetical protein MBR110_30010 [Burkholderia sp. MBR-1]
MEENTSRSESGISVAHDVIRLLLRCQFDLSTEKHLQVDVESAFRENGISFEREARLTASDIPDFLVAGSVVVECKLRGKSRKIDVYRQLERYASHPDVKAIVLASNSVMGLPPEINGKPVYAASLSRGWI